MHEAELAQLWNGHAASAGGLHGCCFRFGKALMLAERWGRTKRRGAPGYESSMPKTVMIVEDNELNMKLFNDLLESRGYSIIQTRNGMEALDLARAHHPDLILMDIQLPEVSGLVVTKWLKEDDDLQAIPVIAVTAFAMKGDEERILSGGCEGYISKPISVPHFLETIARYIGPAN
jgi:two-component system cell cycle response regulator DivK